MAIEAMGSIMTIQAQTVQKAAEIRPAADNMDVVKAEQVTNVDATTAAVPRTEKKVEQNTNNANTKEQQQAANDKIKKAAEQLSKSMPHSEAVFGFHDQTNRVMIKIIDKETKEVLKEYPPEKTLDMIAKVWELAGILVDEKR